MPSDARSGPDDPRPDDPAHAGVRGYFPAMDGLRAVASLMIMVLHLSVMTGMLFRPDGSLGPLVSVVPQFWVAVPVFFAISGFLLYLPWAAAATEGKRRPHVPTYYWHRVLRIVPVYLLLVTASVLMFYPEVLHDRWRLLRIVLLQHTFVASDMPHSSLEPPGTGALTQTWSLSTELHFYLLLPLLAFVLHRLLRRSDRAAFGFLVLAELGSLTWKLSVAGTWRDATGGTTRWMLPGYLGFFAIGMLLAACVIRLRDGAARPAAVDLVLRHPWSCWVAAAVAYAVVSSPLDSGPTGNVVVEEVCYLVIVAGLTAPVALSRGRGPQTLLTRRLPKFLGQISYGVFCWHILVQMTVFRLAGLSWGSLTPLGFVMLLAVTGSASVALAWLSHVLVERPLRRRFRRAPSASIAAAPRNREEVAPIGPGHDEAVRLPTTEGAEATA